MGPSLSMQETHMATKTEDVIAEREKRTRAANKARAAEQKKAQKEAVAEAKEIDQAAKEQ